MKQRLINKLILRKVVCLFPDTKKYEMQGIIKIVFYKVYFIFLQLYVNKSSVFYGTTSRHLKSYRDAKNENKMCICKTHPVFITALSGCHKTKLSCPEQNKLELLRDTLNSSGFGC